MKGIRLSPSGPVLANGAGAGFNPGTGARLRLNEAQTTVGNSNVIPTAPTPIGNALGSTFIECVMPLPDPGLEYRATVVCDVENPSTNVAGQVELYVETSVDGGTTWSEQASNSHRVNSTEVAPAVPLARTVRLDMPLTFGSTLGVTAGTTALLMRCKIGASSGGNVLLLSSPVTPGGDLKSKGTVYFGFEECF